MPRLSSQAQRALIQERKQQILAAAAQVFAKKGFDGATIREIARAAGVAEGSIYNYFKNKQDLLVHIPRQLAQPALDAFSAASAPAPDATQTPEQLLTLVAQNMLNVTTQNREVLRVLLTSLPTMSPELRATYLEQVPLYAVQLLETYIAERQAAGIFRTDLDPATAARIFPGMMLFFVLVQEILQPPELPRLGYDQIIPNVVSIFLRGVQRVPDPAPRNSRRRKQP